MIVGAVLALAFYPAYWLAPDRFRNPLLTLVGMVGVAWFSPGGALALAALVGLVWFGVSDDGGSRALGALSAVVASFIVYKLVARGGPFERPVVLLGLAYAVPRAVHLLVDTRFRGLARPRLDDLLAYFFFAPLVIVGPIHRLSEFTQGVRRRRLDGRQFGLGLERILIGLVSVELLGNWLVTQRFGTWIDDLDPDRDGLAALARSVEYGLNLYFGFAGWSAVAIGLAATVGFVAPENFSRPFAQPNLAAFWRSWHMTLTRWTNDYVFKPVAAQTRRPPIATVATMFAIALWHEFSGRYLAWAIWHAFGLIVHRRFVALRQSGRMPSFGIGPRLGHWLAIGLTTSWVFLGFTITRVDSVGDALTAFGDMLTGGWL